MSERRKKAPKIAWRDLMKPSDDAPAAATPADAPAPDASAMPVPAVPVAAAPEASAPVVAPGEPAGSAPAPAPVSVEADATSPAALAARLDEAFAALVEEAGREESATRAALAKATPAPATPAATPAKPKARKHAPSPSASAEGPPPEINIAPDRAEHVTVRARAAAPAPAQPTAPATTPAATPEAEVQRILARLATYVPVPRVAAAVATELERPDAAHAAPIPRGPLPLEDEDVAPLVTPAGLREAARTRRGRVELLVFRAGGELFALPLGAVEEAIEAPAIHSLPEMPAAMLGVFNLRERLVPTYSPGTSLGVALAEPAGAALLVRSGDRRLALAADDVEDVMELDLSTLRDPPVVEDTDGILLGVARFSRDLVGILDADALIAACLGGRNVENP